jgi:S-adenosyl-L-methionine hydrolase (adenosine-forming)
VPGPICFLTDFGLEDAYVGVVKGVILSIEPRAQIVDLSHAILPQDIRAGAFTLMAGVPYFPAGTVYLAVVDPGVGTERRAVAVAVGDYYFIGPDNGLLSWAILKAARGTDADVVLGDDALQMGRGATAVVLDRPRFWRADVSSTFHGRDVFGPVAAHLARGVALTELGSPTVSMHALPFPTPTRDDGTVRGEVIYVDRFGNLITNVERVELAPNAVVEIAGRTIRGISPHFQQEAELIALVGSSGLLEIAAPNGSAARVLGAGVGAHVRVLPSR